MDSAALFHRYQELQQYVGWTDEDARRVRSVAPILEPCLTALIDDFYRAIELHPGALRVITGGAAQIERLKGTLRRWLRELLQGPYDAEYVARRWRVGWRHVEIGLDQVYENVALSRLRSGLLSALEAHGEINLAEAFAIRRSLNLLLDLDLAIIEDAYQAEYLGRQKAAFRMLVEAAPCTIVISRPDRSILYLNPFAEKLTGYRAADVVGKDLLRIFIDEPVVREAVIRARERALAGQPSIGVEHPIRCKDGTQRHLIWNRQCLLDYAGGPAVLAVGQDVTTLLEAQQKTLQAERLAAIGQMMTGLAHESGNALARSQACLEMLSLEVRDRPEALDLIARIQKAQDHLQQLYEEVRSYAAPFKLDREVWDVALIWRQAWENLVVRRKDRDAVLREECHGIDRRCAVDTFRLEQVFRNILENALSACTDPVRIAIRCTNAELAGRPALRIAIRDNGPGLSAEQSRKIFEPFFTTKTKGTGLGMAIAKRIAEAHGGRIAVGGAGVPGAEIILTLPREGS
jgi:PAS domain S-box-containing protein